MIKRMQVLLFLLQPITLFSPKLKAQTLISGCIADRINASALPYSTLYNTHSQEGVVADWEGRYTILHKPGDTLIIRSVGYAEKQIVHAPDTIYLSPIATPLPVLEVSAQNEVKRLGAAKKSSGIPLVISCFKPYQQHGVFIPKTTTKPARIKTVFAHISTKDLPREIWQSSLRIRFYLPDAAGFPIKDITPRNLLLSPKASGWHEVSVQNDYLYIPKEGIVVAVEWVETQKYHTRKTTKDGGTVRKFGADLIGYKKTKKDNPTMKWVFYDAKKNNWTTYHEYWNNRLPAGNHHSLLAHVPGIAIQVIE